MPDCVSLRQPQPHSRCQTGNQPARPVFSRAKSWLAGLPASFLRGYRALWLVGFLFWLAAVHWLRLPHWATGFGWVALAAYLAFYLPVFIGLSRVAMHRLRIPVILAAPVV